jgi:phenylalanyl-tRNA synthetase beta chain
MQFSKKWLQEFFDDSLDDLDLDEILTSAGIEVEDVKDLAKLSEDIVVGEIIDVKKHPDADRLNVCHLTSALKIFYRLSAEHPMLEKG